ncbi:DUF6449 domain-containing protein [Alkalihalobacterium bogoriense]|uniref:DUF6449 domain-containing protein n=1 Tax=Alkalihalobacterium bogoriense TaxID=246272 RepID=UPI000479B6DA|nr:DUF6449 domain-containing protein [Alkalihalobacterium bogoriense]
MSSKTSFFNKGILLQDLKQHGWIGIVFLIGLLYSNPLQLLMAVSNQYYPYTYVTNLFLEASEWQSLFLFIMPALAAIFLFRYIHVKDSADMIHSLPITRFTLLANHLLSGVILLLLPIWITGVIAWFVTQSHQLYHFVTIGDLFQWLLLYSLLALFLFAFTTTVGMFTGLSVAQGILTYILLFLPIGLFQLVVYQLELLLYGFSNLHISSWIEKLSPLTRLYAYIYMPYTLIEIITYVFVTIALFVLSNILYKYRHIEKASEPITFSILKPIFKYGVTFCSMLVIGSHFASMQSNQVGWVIFGYGTGSIIGYLIASMVLKKSWRVFDRGIIKGFGIYTSIILALLLVVKFDLIGFEDRVPSLDSIESVYFNQNSYLVSVNFEGNSTREVPFINDKELIQLVRKLHQDIVETKPEEITESHWRNTPITFTYQLINGQKVSRRYQIPVQHIDTHLKEILESDVYKQHYFSLAELQTSQLSKIRIYSYHPISKQGKVFTSEEEISEFLSVIKQDINALTYEDMMSWNSWGYISIEMDNNDYIDLEWNKAFQYIDLWLAEKGVLEDIRIVPSDIELMEIITPTEITEETYYTHQLLSGEYDYKILLSSQNMQEIEEALTSYEDTEHGLYHVRFFTKNGAEFYGTFPKDKLPSFLQ